MCNNHKPLAKFLNGKNTNNKVNTWDWKLMTYNIMFECISGAWNKAADCLSRLVELPSDSKATIKMLTATNWDRPAFNTRSKTSHHCQTNMDTEPSSIQTIKETVTPDVTTVDTTQDITLKPLSADGCKTLLQMQKIDPFLKASPNSYQMARHNSMRPIYSHTLRDYYTHTSWMEITNLWHSSYQKSWKYTVLVEAHDRLAYQGTTHMYCLIKQQYY